VASKVSGAGPARWPEQCAVARATETLVTWLGAGPSPSGARCHTARARPGVPP